jgi:hypothetical protein
LREDIKFVVGGAAVGAVVGAVLGWLLSSKARQGGAQGAAARQVARALDPSQVMRLGWGVVGIVRQILELG